MQAIINGKRYDTEKAELIAHNRYWDGHNFERQGRNQFLYKTKIGNFFLHTTTLWQGERDSIIPLDLVEAMSEYEKLPEQEIEYETAFELEPEEA